MTGVENDRTQLAVFAAFQKHYFDLGVYRFMARNIKSTRIFFIGSFMLAVACALMELRFFCFFFGSAFILLGWIGAIDHLLIGRSRVRVIEALEAQNVHIGWEEAVEIYGLR